jgi:hypothetical protein
MPTPSKHCLDSSGNINDRTVSEYLETPRGAILTEPALRHEEPRLSPARRASSNRVVVLGWGQFWLFAGILGSLLAMFIVILFAHLSSL